MALIPNEADSEVISITPLRQLEPLGLLEVWRFRGMLYFLAMRDIKVRYRQTVLGLGWAVIQPLTTMMVMTLVFSRIGRVNTGDVPYAVFAFTALLPWQLFVGCLTRSSQSVISEQHLVTKVYFPRLVLPIAALCTSLLDFCVGFLVLLGLMVWYRVPVQMSAVGLPVVVLIAMATSLAFGTWFAALNARFRDFGHVVPLLTQAWLFLSPIAYPSALITADRSPWFTFAYHLNPVGVIAEGSRWAVLGQPLPPVAPSLVSLGLVVVLLVGGLYFYKRQADTFADYV